MALTSSKPHVPAVLDDEQDPVGSVSRAREATLTSAAPAMTLSPAVVPGPLGRVTAAVGDVLGLVGIAFCIPLVILGIGIPIALCVRLLLWIVGVRGL